jgi:gamma-glutamyl-gamma-aminobutyrate hydrolase PuuD
VKVSVLLPKEESVKVKKRIGIAPAPYINIEASCMGDFYKLGNNYVMRTAEAGCIPIGLAPVNYWIPDEALEMCDGFLVQGGAEFYPYHFQIVHHALTTGKKYLGICLGEQIIYVYFKVRSIVEAAGYEGDLLKAICDYYGKLDPGFSFQKKAIGHRNAGPARGEEDSAKHDVNVVPGTLLHRVLGRDSMRLCSFHDLYTPNDQTLVKINAWSALGDGVVEGTEYGENILGVQGHPEADDLLPELFRFLAT